MQKKTERTMCLARKQKIVSVDNETGGLYWTLFRYLQEKGFYLGKIQGESRGPGNTLIYKRFNDRQEVYWSGVALQHLK